MGTQRSSDGSLIVGDQRDDLPIFIHSELDDLSLSLEAFRVYAHLARRAGRNNKAWPSYNSIAEHCFRASYPKAKQETLRRKAIAAVKELVDHGLIVKMANREENGDHKSNHYALTARDKWASVNTLPSVNTLGGSANTLGSVNAPKDTPIEDTPKQKAARPPAQVDTELPEAYWLYERVFLYPPFNNGWKQERRAEVLNQLENISDRYSKDTILAVFEDVAQKDLESQINGKGKIGDKLAYAAKILRDDAKPKSKRVRVAVQTQDPFTRQIEESIVEMTLEQAQRQNLEILEHSS
jgi:hypothetical protein